MVQTPSKLRTLKNHCNPASAYSHEKGRTAFWARNRETNIANDRLYQVGLAWLKNLNYHPEPQNPRTPEPKKPQSSQRAKRSEKKLEYLLNNSGNLNDYRRKRFLRTVEMTASRLTMSAKFLGSPQIVDAASCRVAAAGSRCPFFAGFRQNISKQALKHEYSGVWRVRPRNDVLV